MNSDLRTQARLRRLAKATVEVKAINNDIQPASLQRDDPNCDHTTLLDDAQTV
jgi:hypothetical protein